MSLDDECICQVCSGSSDQLGSSMCDSWQDKDTRSELQSLRETGLCHHEMCVKLKQCKRTDCDSCQANSNHADMTNALSDCQAQKQCSENDHPFSVCRKSGSSDKDSKQTHEWLKSGVKEASNKVQYR